jgi:hypothetical protein
LQEIKILKAVVFTNSLDEACELLEKEIILNMKIRQQSSLKKTTILPTVTTVMDEKKMKLIK